MKIKFLKNTNIRSNHRSTDLPPIGVVYANTEIEVDGIIHEGVTLKGVNRWWRDLNGWYYWAGETESMVPQSEINTTSQPPISSLSTSLTPSPSTTTPEPTHPPIPADSLVSLPIPDDNIAHALPIPEGEWRSLDEHFLTSPEFQETGSDIRIAEPFEALAPALANGNIPVRIEILSPRPEQLNWGLEAGRIPSDWWLRKQLTGRNVKLALLGAGVDTQHPDLKGIPYPIFGKFIDNQPFGDSHGLGTQAAIIAAGKGHIAYGVAPEVQLLLGKIGSTPNDITPESLIAGLEWAIAQKADVAALLVDFLELSEVQKQHLSDVIARALDANMVLIAPVGNSSERKPENRFPAAMEGVISVGAHHSFNRRSDFSAKSYHLDFLAPGEGLNTSDLQQGFGANLKTTAIATAFAAGLVALIRQWEKQRNQVFSPGDMAALLRDTAHYEGINKGKDTEVGYGILNPQAVLERLMT